MMGKKTQLCECVHAFECVCACVCGVPPIASDQSFATAC